MKAGRWAKCICTLKSFNFPAPCDRDHTLRAVCVRALVSGYTELRRCERLFFREVELEQNQWR